jgi:AcrR family transcriptional regulator
MMQEQLDLQPRKLPRQMRSIATVDAILQATMEVLKRNDAGGASTTRIALRAGVSVGTLYQYFPHQDALRFAALQRHLEHLAVALEQLCARHRRKPLAMLAHDFAVDYLELKIARAADRLLLQHHMSELGLEPTKAAVFTRAGVALGDLLQSAGDGGFSGASSTAVALLGEMHAITSSAAVISRDPAGLAGLRRDLPEFVRRYLGVQGAAADSIEMRIA